MFSEINASTEHSTNVCMSLIKTFLNNCINEWAAMEKHAFACLVDIFISNFLSSMHVSLPELTILNLLNLKMENNLFNISIFSKNVIGYEVENYSNNIVSIEESARLAVITMLTNCRLHFFFHC